MSNGDALHKSDADPEFNFWAFFLRPQLYFTLTPLASALIRVVILTELVRGNGKLRIFEFVRFED